MHFCETIAMSTYDNVVDTGTTTVVEETRVTERAWAVVVWDETSESGQLHTPCDES